MRASLWFLLVPAVLLGAAVFLSNMHLGSSVAMASARFIVHPLAQMRAQLNFGESSTSLVLHVQLEDLYWFEQLSMDSEDTVAVKDLRYAADLHVDRLLARIRLFDIDGQPVVGKFERFDFPELDVERLKNIDLNKFLMQYRFTFPEVPGPAVNIVHDIGVEQAVPADIELELSFRGVDSQTRFTLQPLLSVAIPTTAASQARWPSLANDLEMLLQVDAARLKLIVQIPSALLYLWSGAERKNPDLVSAAEVSAASQRLKRIVSRNLVLECDGKQLQAQPPQLQWLNRHHSEPQDGLASFQLHNLRCELHFEYARPESFKKGRLAVMLIRPPVERIPLKITLGDQVELHMLSYAKRFVDFEPPVEVVEPEKIENTNSDSPASAWPRILTGLLIFVALGVLLSRRKRGTH